MNDVPLEVLPVIVKPSICPQSLLWLICYFTASSARCSSDNYLCCAKKFYSNFLEIDVLVVLSQEQRMQCSQTNENIGPVITSNNVHIGIWKRMPLKHCTCTVISCNITDWREHSVLDELRLQESALTEEELVPIAAAVNLNGRVSDLVSS